MNIFDKFVCYTLCDTLQSLLNIIQFLMLRGQNAVIYFFGKTAKKHIKNNSLFFKKSN